MVTPSGIRGEDVWSIPLSILRAVGLNAIVHTDYSQRGAAISVAFFDDRIEVENPGILVTELTIEDIKEGFPAFGIRLSPVSSANST